MTMWFTAENFHDPQEGDHSGYQRSRREKERQASGRFLSPHAARCIEFKCIFCVIEGARVPAWKRFAGRNGNNICLAKNCDCNFRVPPARPSSSVSPSPAEQRYRSSPSLSSGALERVQPQPQPQPQPVREQACRTSEKKKERREKKKERNIIPPRT